MSLHSATRHWLNACFEVQVSFASLPRYFFLPLHLWYFELRVQAEIDDGTYEAAKGIGNAFQIWVAMNDEVHVCT